MKKIVIGVALLAASQIAFADGTTASWYVENFNLEVKGSGEQKEVNFLRGSETYKFQYLTNEINQSGGRIFNPDVPGYGSYYDGGTNIVQARITGFAEWDPFSYQANVYTELSGPYNITRYNATLTGILEFQANVATELVFSWDYFVTGIVPNSKSSYYLSVTIDTGAPGGPQSYARVFNTDTTSFTDTPELSVWWIPGVSNQSVSISFDVAALAVPEPSNYDLLVLGLGVIGFAAKCRLRLLS